MVCCVYYLGLNAGDGCCYVVVSCKLVVFGFSLIVWCWFELLGGCTWRGYLELV